MSSSKISSALKIKEVAADVTIQDNRCVIRNKDGQPTCYLEKDVAKKIGLIPDDKA